MISFTGAGFGQNKTQNPHRRGGTDIGKTYPGLRTPPCQPTGTALTDYWIAPARLVSDRLKQSIIFRLNYPSFQYTHGISVFLSMLGRLLNSEPDGATQHLAGDGPHCKILDHSGLSI
jgi:hypothetical protein